MGTITPWWASLVSAVAGGFLTGLFAFGGILYAQAQQGRREQVQRERDRERDYQGDARALRDAKRERLRAVYSDLLASAWAINDFPVEAQMGPPDESEEDRRARLTRWLDRANRGADEVLLRMALERDATPVKEAYRDLRDTFRRYRQSWSREEWDRAQALHTDIFNAVGRLEAQVRAQLAEMDRPIPPAPELPSPAPTPTRRWFRRGGKRGQKAG